MKRILALLLSLPLAAPALAQEAGPNGAARSAPTGERHEGRREPARRAHPRQHELRRERGRVLPRRGVRRLRRGLRAERRHHAADERDPCPCERPAPARPPEGTRSAG